MTKPKPTRPLTQTENAWVDWLFDHLPHPVRRVLEVADDAHDFESACECPPCPGKGLDGNGMNHCAECCWGSGVIADIDCPEHGWED